MGSRSSWTGSALDRHSLKMISDRSDLVGIAHTAVIAKSRRSAYRLGGDWR